MEEPVLKVDRLSHRYSVQWAIRDISFELPRRGIYGLLGSNGAGKSTTMNIVSGVIKQTSGTVKIKGIDTREDPVAAKRLIGFLPQKPPLYNDMTVDEYLTYCAKLRWVPADKVASSVDEVLGRCGIMHFRKRQINAHQRNIAADIKPAFLQIAQRTFGIRRNQGVGEYRQSSNCRSSAHWQNTEVQSGHIHQCFFRHQEFVCRTARSQNTRLQAGEIFV